MREILFKGKRADNREWVVGYYSYANDGHSTELYMIGEKVTGVHYPVIPDTVGQFTGMFDSTKWEQLTEEEQLDWLKNHTIDEWNGRMIFEGDIVDCWSEGINAQGAVQQRIDGLWIIYPAWQNQQFWGLCPNRNGSTSVKIIGNIHDNPELLKGGAE